MDCGKQIFFRNGGFYILADNGIDCIQLQLPFGAGRGGRGARGAQGIQGPIGPAGPTIPMDFLSSYTNQPNGNVEDGWSNNPQVPYTIPVGDAFWFYPSTSFSGVTQTQDATLAIFDNPASYFTFVNAGTYKITFHLHCNQTFTDIGQLGRVNFVDDTNSIIFGSVLSDTAVSGSTILYQDILTVVAGQKLYVKNTGEVAITFGSTDSLSEGNRAAGSITIEQIR